MNYRRLGASGLKVSELSLGAWVTYGGQVGEEAATKCMSAAFEAGVNFFDNAEAYAHGNAEIVMGNVIRKLGWRREDLVVSSKVFWGGRGPNDQGLSRKHVIEACRNSLKRLQLDYLDLFFCHRPDPETPIEETVRAMDDLVHGGTVHYWGTSMWSKEAIEEAIEICDRRGLTPPTMEQPVYNLLQRDKVEKEYIPLYSRAGLGLTTWSPLASGLLTGKYNAGIPPGSRATLENMKWLRESMLVPQNLSTVAQLQPISEDLGCTMAQLAIAWCLRNHHVSTVITGASNPDQVVENLKSTEVVPGLNAEKMQRIDSVLAGKPQIESD